MKALKLVSSVAPSILLLVPSVFPGQVVAADQLLELGTRPAELLSSLPAGDLRSELQSCAGHPATGSRFSISHRGAPLKYPEHTREGYIAAAQMGAGIIECDVTFTRDRALVCRHSQCDLHTTTNILQTPLAAKCSVPPDSDSGTPYKHVKCCTSDITLAEFKSLRGKADHGNKNAATLSEYLSMGGTSAEELQNLHGTLMTHRESIVLFRELGVQMIPELKQPQVPMPFEGMFTQEMLAQALVHEYINARANPADVFMQSFNLDDVHYWIKNAPGFGGQAVWLDGRYRDRSFNVSDDSSWIPSMTELADSGVKILAPPLWMLLTLDDEQQIVPSAYARAASAAGLDLIAWTLERSGSLRSGGGWYYQSVKDAISTDGDVFSVLDVLARQVKVRGVFSDWPATVTYFANCVGAE